jgi:hypothetical protein
MFDHPARLKFCFSWKMLGVDYIYVDPDALRDEATGELPQGVFTSIYQGIEMFYGFLVFHLMPSDSSFG